jgi:hypothetical protein
MGSATAQKSSEKTCAPVSRVLWPYGAGTRHASHAPTWTAADEPLGAGGAFARRPSACQTDAGLQRYADCRPAEPAHKWASASNRIIVLPSRRHTRPTVRMQLGRTPLRHLIAAAHLG